MFFVLPQGVEGTSQLVPVKEGRDTAGPGSKAIPGQAPPCLWGQRALPGMGAYCGRFPLADAALHLQMGGQMGRGPGADYAPGGEEWLQGTSGAGSQTRGGQREPKAGSLDNFCKKFW